MRQMPRWREWLSVCADILQVTTFFGLTVAAIVAGLVMLIGWLTAVPLFWIAVGTPVAALATVLTLNRLKKPAESPAGSIDLVKDQFKKELEHKAHLNRQQLFSGATSKPRYAPPKGEENFPIGSVSFRDLGDMMIKAAQEVSLFVRKAPYNASNAQIVNGFLSEYAPRVFWLCEEAKNRGLHNEHLDLVRQYPDRLQNRDGISYISHELEKFRNVVKLYT